MHPLQSYFLDLSAADWARDLNPWLVPVLSAWISILSKSLIII
jgi:hypothetical protein